jgi:hypothetical protein
MKVMKEKMWTMIAKLKGDLRLQRNHQRFQKDHLRSQKDPPLYL